MRRLAEREVGDLVAGEGLHVLVGELTPALAAQQILQTFLAGPEGPAAVSS
jgi:hypothetical protein